MKEFLFSTKAVGRRKTAVALVELIPGSGQFKINGRIVEDFFKGQKEQLWTVQKPFHALDGPIFDVSAKVRGGGIQSQSRALQLALTRSLVIAQPSTLSSFRVHKFLTRDSRMKERRKYGLKKARKAPQFSKRL